MFRKYFAGLMTVAVLLVAGSMALSVQASQLAQAPQPPQIDQRFSLERWPQAPAQSDASDRSGPSTPAAVQGFMQWSKIAFQSSRDGNWEIYIANGDGTGQLRLTADSASDTYPRLNRGGTRIVFDSNRSGTYQIYTMNPDGTGLSQITASTGNNYDPAWSPDGSKIAFESFRDGQAEIYVMNANGTGLIRLTNNPAFDGHPVWSPDGSKIAFTSDRGTPANTGNRVWVMNADGGSPQQFSTQYYSQNPNWSPDGTRIAYDGDATNDGSQEIWLVNADGSGAIQVYNPPDESPLGYPGLTDAWVRGWSPNGAFVTYTRLTWIYYQGAWYWYTGYLEACDPTTSNVFRLVSTQGDDWYPDWQSIDIGLPTSKVNALPSQSPGPFTVSWSGSDTGPSGIQNYDVQVKDGDAGSWVGWQSSTSATSASYPGIGGHTYYFRSRARDNADNVEAWSATPDASTTVEALPPTAALPPLAPYTRGAATVIWSGSDAGGSGIKSYDVQYRDSTSGVWVNWQTAVTMTSAAFTGTPGHTVEFRARALDRAFNQGDWSAADSRQATTFYAWLVSGKVWDNAHYPVAGSVISITPAALAAFPTGRDWQYQVYGAESAATYWATWPTAGFGYLPATAFGFNPVNDARLDVVLPPADDVIQNGGFETGDWGNNAWQVMSGEVAIVSDTVGHTGRHAAQLGGPLLNTGHVAGSGYTTAHKLGVDATGTVHAVWRTQVSDNDAEIFYSQRPVGGGWSNPLNISNTPQGWSDTPRLAVASDGTVHVEWDDGSLGAAYTRRSPAGQWTTPQPLPNGGGGAVRMMIDSADVLHLVWSGSSVMYMRRTPNGNWSVPENVSGDTGSYLPDFVIDTAGGVHVVWGNIVGWNYDLFYAYRLPAGGWSTPRNFTNSLWPSFAPAMAVAADGTLHLTWNENTQLVYASRNTNGIWSSTQMLPGGPDSDLAIDSRGTLHLVIGGLYLQRRPDGSWTEPVYVGGCQINSVVSPATHGRWTSNSLTLALDHNDTLHVVWGGVFYSRHSVDGTWLDPIYLTDNPGWAGAPRLVVSPAGVPTMIWQTETITDTTAYADLTLAAQASEATLVQSVTVPLTLTNPTLSFLYKYQPGLTTPISGSEFMAEVVDGAGSHLILMRDTPADGWTHFTYDVSPWAGQSISLTFRLRQSPNQPQQRAYLDEVTIGSWLTPVLVSAQPQRIPVGLTTPITIAGLNFIGALPGESYPLRVGDTPLLDAHWINSTTLTATVPATISFGTYTLIATNPGGQSGMLPYGLLIGERAYFPVMRK